MQEIYDSNTLGSHHQGVLGFKYRINRKLNLHISKVLLYTPIDEIINTKRRMTDMESHIYRMEMTNGMLHHDE